MPITLNGRIGSHIEHRGGRLRIRKVKPLRESKLWRYQQGKLRTIEFANWRDHTDCNCSIRDQYRDETERLARIEESRHNMPKLVDTKVGSRPGREGTTIEWLIPFDDLLNGDYLTQAISKGLRLEAGEDFKVLDSDGNEAVIKTTPEKVAKELKAEIAERLNRPTTVRIPPTGKDVTAESRQWVEFRPRDEFPNDAEKLDYLSNL